MYITILIGVILAAGFLGGTANYYMEKSNGAGYWKSVLLGLTASATVPLFLKTVSSQLLADCLKETDRDETAFFVFFGFCTVAAIFSSKFLQSLGDKLLQEMKEVKQKQEELAETTDVLVAQNSDPSENEPAIAIAVDKADPSEFESFKIGESSKSAAPAMSDEQKIMAMLQSGKFAFRTPEGIAKDGNMDLSMVQRKLNELEKQGMVKKTKRARDGAMVWCLR